VRSVLHHHPPGSALSDGHLTPAGSAAADAITDALTATATAVARENLAAQIREGPWLDWAACLIPTLTIEAVIAWLDAGRPDPDRAADRIGRAVHGVIAAAQSDLPVLPDRSETRTAQA
jgi:hypothetical protein